MSENGSNDSNQPVDEYESEFRAALPELKKYYMTLVDSMGLPVEDMSRFSWYGNKHLQIFVARHAWDLNTDNAFLIWIKPSTENEDQLVYFNFVTQTSKYQYFDYVQPATQLHRFIDETFLSPHAADGIIPNAIFYVVGTGILNFNNHITDRLVKLEYDSSEESLSQKVVSEPFPTTNQRLFVDRLHLDSILTVIGDEQFTDELNQCLFAYEHEKWFLCAAALGSCIEELLQKVCINFFGREDAIKFLGSNPTASKYYKALANPPCNATDRQITYLKLLFTARNSVDHFNSGYTSKTICDIMLQGIANIYGEYFLRSKDYINNVID